MPGDAAQDLVEDVCARGYESGYREGISGAVTRDVAVRKAEQAVTYSAEARFDKHHQARAEEAERRGGGESERSSARSRSVPEVGDASRADHARAMRETHRQVVNPRAVGAPRREREIVEHHR